MEKQTICAICILVIGITISVVMAINDSDSDVDLVFTEDTGRLEMVYNFTEPDYSEEGYIQITPKEQERLIYLECINSTLMIADNKIYCEAI